MGSVKIVKNSNNAYTGGAHNLPTDRQAHVARPLMFPHTHLYCSQQIRPNASPLFYYGTVFPDFPVVKLLSWDRMKAETEMLSEYITKRYPNLGDFAEGLLYHEEPKGVDRFVHGDDGYAYVLGRKILPEIEKYFPDRSLVVAHSFIEFSVEVLIIERHPELREKMEDIASLEPETLKSITKALASYFRFDLATTRQAIEEYNELLQDMEMAPRDLAVEYYTWLTNKLRGTSHDRTVIQKLLTLALEQTESTYEKTLADIIRQCP